MTIVNKTKGDIPEESRAEIKRMYNANNASKMLDLYVGMIKDKYGPDSLTSQEIVSALKDEFRYLITLSSFERYYTTTIEKRIEDKRLQMKTLGIVYDEERQQETGSSDINRDTDRDKA